MKDEFIDSVLKEYFSIDDEIKRLTKSKEKLRDIIVSNFKLNNTDSKEYIIEDCDYNASVSSVTRKTTTPIWILLNNIFLIVEWKKHLIPK